MTTRLHLAFAAVATLTLGAATALAQHNHAAQPAHQEKLAHQEKPAAPASKDADNQRVGDPYALDTCPITGKKLGSMGDPVVKVYEGREVRFCCPNCPPKFEKDLAANLAKLDEKMIKDQGPHYPLKTSLVTGKDLPAKPYEFIYGNRLVRLGAESEKAEFLKEPKKYLGDLDKAVVNAQGKDFPFTKCPVSGEAYGGDMGKPVDLVVANRLVRLSRKECKKDIEKEPAKFVAMIDAARNGEHAAAPDHDEKNHDKKDHDEHKSHDHDK